MSTLGTNKIVSLMAGSDLVTRAALVTELQRIETGIKHLTAKQTGTSTTAYATDAPYQAYSNGMEFVFLPHYANTAACTINVNALGAKKLCDVAGTQLSAAGAIAAYKAYLLIYDTALDGGAGAFRARALDTDTDTNTQARSATLSVAASNSSAAGKACADYLCDGTADEVQINAAIVAAGGGNVVLLEGTYNLAASIVINNVSGLTLEGVSFGAVLEWEAAIGGAGSDNAIEITGTSARCALRNFTLVHNVDNAGATADVGINLVDAGAANVIEGILIRQTTGFFTQGILVNPPLTRVSGCMVEGPRYGIVINSDADYCIVTGNMVQECIFNGMDIDGSYCIVTGNLAGQNDQMGIALTGAGHTIKDNQVVLNGVVGIYAELATDGLIQGNNCVDNGTAGSATDAGIILTQCTRVAVMGNICRAPTADIQEYGVQVAGSSTNCLVTGNDLINGGVTACIADAGTGTIVTHNRVTSGFGDGLN